MKARMRLGVSFRQLYGAGPSHLLAHLLGISIAALAVDRIFSGGGAAKLLVWFLGLVVAHDLLFLPAYTGLDRLFRSALVRIPRLQTTGVPIVNHLRAPALISGLLVIIYLPLISGRSDGAYFALSGHHLAGDYLRNWLLITAALFFGSGLIYALRVVRTRARLSEARLPTPKASTEQ